MKHLLIIVFSLSLYSLFAVSTPRSLPFSDSYQQRAFGTDALYWNPANLGQNHDTSDFYFMNMGIQISNNILDLDKYNYYTGRYLTQSDKDDLLGEIEGKLNLTVDYHQVIIAKSFNHFAFGVGLNATGSGNLSEDFMKLALEGSSDSVSYRFDKDENNVQGLSYVDFSFGAGGYPLSGIFPKLASYSHYPEVYWGTTASILYGIAAYSTSSYNGVFSTGDVGMNLNQDITLKEGYNGIGAKLGFGIRSEVIPHLNAGLFLDNIVGFIHWSGSTKKHQYTVEGDSIYFADLGDDFYTSADTSWSIPSYSSSLPLALSFGLKYDFPAWVLSLDWIENLQDSNIGVVSPKLSFGLEYQGLSHFPLQLGLTVPNADQPLQFAYGVCFRNKQFETGIGIKTYGSIVPGYHSKGVSLSFHGRFLQ